MAMPGGRARRVWCVLLSLSSVAMVNALQPAFPPSAGSRRLGLAPWRRAAATTVAHASSLPPPPRDEALQPTQAWELGEAPVLSTMHQNGYMEIRLNRANKFNALDSEMLDLLLEAIDRAIIEGATGILLTATQGKAFCAGGDIKHVAGLEPVAQSEFLLKEYVDHHHRRQRQRQRQRRHRTAANAANAANATATPLPAPRSLSLVLYPTTLRYRVHSQLARLAETIPVISVGDGIVMGAGAGLYMAAATRIVTERTLFAMPEVQIGLVPDAGAMHFLNELCEPAVGMYAAVTGGRLNARDTLDQRLGTHFVRSSDVQALLSALQVGVRACECAGV